MLSGSLKLWREVSVPISHVVTFAGTVSLADEAAKAAQTAAMSRKPKATAMAVQNMLDSRHVHATLAASVLQAKLPVCLYEPSAAPVQFLIQLMSLTDQSKDDPLTRAGLEGHTMALIARAYAALALAGALETEAGRAARQTARPSGKSKGKRKGGKDDGKKVERHVDAEEDSQEKDKKNMKEKNEDIEQPMVVEGDASIEMSLSTPVSDETAPLGETARSDAPSETAPMSDEITATVPMSDEVSAPIDTASIETVPEVTVPEVGTPEEDEMPKETARQMSSSDACIELELAIVKLRRLLPRDSPLLAELLMWWHLHHGRPACALNLIIGAMNLSAASAVTELRIVPPSRFSVLAELRYELLAAVGACEQVVENARMLMVRAKRKANFVF